MTNVLRHVPQSGLALAQRQSLAFGALGTALLHIVRACTGAEEWDTAHQWVTTVTRGPVAAHTEANLFYGAPAVAFVLRIAAKRSHTTVLAALDDHITALTRARLDQAYARISRGELPRLGEYDLISGLTGIGVYLFQAQNADLLREVLAYLVRLTATVTIGDRRLPGWWTLHGPSDRPDPRWPGGHANLGLAHGISGPLALLAQTMLHGITVPARQKPSLTSTGYWIVGFVTFPIAPGGQGPSPLGNGKAKPFTKPARNDRPGATELLVWPALGSSLLSP